MNNVSDSGMEKRYNKASTMDDKDIQMHLSIATNHIYDHGYKASEYTSYIRYATEILKDTNNYKEKAIIFNHQNEIILEKLGNIKSIQFTEEECKKMDGHYFIHNHPSGQTFSFDDIAVAIKYGLKEIVAFTGKGIYYRLIIKDKKDTQEYVLKYKKAKKKAAETVFKLVKYKHFTKEQADLEYTHIIISLFANSMKGITYEKTKH